MGGASIHVLKLHKHSFRDVCYCQLAHLVRHVLGLRLRDGARLRWVFWLIVRDRCWLNVCGGHKLFGRVKDDWALSLEWGWCRPPHGRW